MSWSRLIARQLKNPSALLAPQILGPMWNRRNSALNDVAFDALAPSAQDRVLEVGFGGGYLLGRLSKLVANGLVAGVDVSPAMVRSCQRRYRSLVQKGALEISCASAESLPYPVGFFNKACSVNSIFYWNHAEQAISELSRVLTADGLLVLCFTCKESLASRGFARHGLRLFDKEEIQSMMELVGFGKIETMHHADRYREFLCLSGRKKPMAN